MAAKLIGYEAEFAPIQSHISFGYQATTGQTSRTGFISTSEISTELTVMC
jgi:hypothetical protein